MDNREMIKAVANHYGFVEQSHQCKEEMAELSVALNKFRRKQLDHGKIDFSQAQRGSKEEQAVLEEIADVQVMLWQLMYLLRMSRDVLDRFAEYKLSRTMAEIEKECGGGQ